MQLKKNNFKQFFIELFSKTMGSNWARSADDGNYIPPANVIKMDSNYASLLSGEALHRIRLNPNSILEIKNPPDDLIYQAVISKPSLAKEFSNMKPDLQLGLIVLNPFIVTHMVKQPNDDLILEAFANYEQQMCKYRGTELFSTLENPSSRIIEAAIRLDTNALGHVKHPSEKMQLLAVSLDPEAIRLISDPSENIQIVAVKNYPETMTYLNRPVEGLLEKSGWAMFIPDPDIFITQAKILENLPDAVVLKVRVQKDDETSILQNLRIELDQEVKSALATTKSFHFGDYCKTHLKISEDGILRFIQYNDVTEYGRPVHYMIDEPINKSSFIFNQKEINIEKENGINRSLNTKPTDLGIESSILNDNNTKTGLSR